VINDVPDNTVVGGNPAKPIKSLNPNRRMLTREFLFNAQAEYDDNQHELNRFLMLNNSTWYWLRTKIGPSTHD